MIHMASALSVGVVFIFGLWTPISTIYSRRRGAYTRDKIPMQELELKMEGGGLCPRGGIIAGFYGTIIQSARLKS